LCDPAKGIGTAKQFDKAEDLEAYVNFFVASLKPSGFMNWRMFITNDFMEFSEVDHFVLMDDYLSSGSNKETIEEINIKDVAREVNSTFIAQEASALEKMEGAEQEIKKLLEANSAEDIKQMLEVE